MVEIVFALLLLQDHKILEHRYHENAINVASYILGSESMNSLMPCIHFRYKKSLEEKSHTLPGFRGVMTRCEILSFH